MIFSTGVRLQLFALFRIIGFNWLWVGLLNLNDVKKSVMCESVTEQEDP